MRALLLALHLMAVPDDSAATRRRAESAARAFLDHWRSAWERAEEGDHDASMGRGPTPAFERLRRKLALHCHFDTIAPDIRPNIITGRVVAHASCPSWIPTQLHVGDEREGLDAALQPHQRADVQRRRVALIMLLDSAARRDPTNVWYAQQRVRFALDAQFLGAAQAAAAECTGDPVQCTLLRGLTAHRDRRIALADSLFLQAAAEMPPQARCEWESVAVLLEREDRGRYEALPCSERPAFDARFWWLADPLYSEPGNERRAEHFARRTHLALLASLGHDSRLRWKREHGGEAASEALLRYGWPTHVYWGGRQEDHNHDRYLLRKGAVRVAPYALLEYSRDRIRTTAPADLVDRPFDARHDSWQLVPEGDHDGWWPTEHFRRPAGSLETLPSGQTAILRRFGASRVVWAGDLDAAVLRHRHGTVLDATLLVSREPDSVHVLGRRQAPVGSTLVVDGFAPGGPTLLGVEVADDSAPWSARTRFGLVVAPSLAETRDSLGVSQPVLFRPDGAGTGSIDDAELLGRMLGTTALGSTTRRLGVYWEGYGFEARDTVDIELHVYREDRPGVLERIGNVLRLEGSERGGVALRWREAPGSSRAVQRADGGVAIQLRSVVLDVARLERGNYRLRVLLARPGSPVVEADRTFSIR